MKPVIWVITIAMFLSMILVGVSSLKSSMSNEVPAFKLNGHVVWGATAMMLSEIKDLLKQL